MSKSPLYIVDRDLTSDARPVAGEKKHFGEEKKRWAYVVKMCLKSIEKDQKLPKMTLK